MAGPRRCFAFTRSSGFTNPTLARRISLRAGRATFNASVALQNRSRSAGGNVTKALPRVDEPGLSFARKKREGRDLLAWAAILSALI